MQSLKEKLLGLDIFEDNEYLDFYCELIEKNRETKRERFKTEKHHVIPVIYYKQKYHLSSREDAELMADADENNFKINLKFLDHILAHYYLYLCCNDTQVRACSRYCLILMCGKEDINNLNEFDLKKLSDIREEHIQENSIRMRGKSLTKNRIMPIDERMKRCIVMQNLVKSGQWKNPMSSSDVIEKMRQTLKEKYANGTFVGRRGKKHTEESKKLMSEHCTMRKLEYRMHHSKMMKGKTPWNKGKKGVQHSAIKGKRAIHKDNINKYVNENELALYLDMGWELGMKSSKSKKLDKK